MSENDPTNDAKPAATRTKRLCGICKMPGYDRRNCPSLVATTAPEVVYNSNNNQNALNEQVILTPVTQPPPQSRPKIIWNDCLYILFDLETTGGSKMTTT